MIGERFNFEDVFFRDLTVCVLDTFEGQVRWVNRFSSGDVPVKVPFYYSLTGDERFLLDSFSDDIVSENRFVELNTDLIPRGHLTMTGFNIKSDEFANPNVWLRMVVENEIEIRKVLAKVRAIPITVNYELTILLSSEIDTFKCAQAIMDTMWIYKFMYFEHNFMNIDAVILMPDTNQIEMSREKNLTSDNNIKLNASFEVSTYYPAFRKDRISMTGYPRYEGTGMSDLNQYQIDGGVSDLFPQIGDPPWRPTGEPVPFGPVDPSIPPSIGSVGGSEHDGSGAGGNTGNPPGVPISQSGTNPFNPDNNPFGNGFGNTSSNFFGKSSYPSGSDPSRQVVNGRLANDPDYYMIAPKRTRWFNNILQARQKAAAAASNPNAGNPAPGNNGGPNPPINPNTI
jgi:hypothetical protein